jgi:hypothetical protein
MLFLGLSFTLNSLHTHGADTCATPIFGCLVVNGYGCTSAYNNVAALKKVVLPVFVLPTKPILILAIQNTYATI